MHTRTSSTESVPNFYTFPISSFSHHIHSQSDDEESDTPSRHQKRKPGRKTIPGVPKDKRVAQNRQAQRAFRERKDAYLRSVEKRVQEGEARIAELTAHNDQLQRENAILRQSAMIGGMGHPNLGTSKMSILDLNMDFSSHLEEEEPISGILALSPSPISVVHEPLMYQTHNSCCSGLSLGVSESREAPAFVPVPADPLLIPDAEVMRNELKAIHSLQNSPHVDELMKLRLEVNTMTDLDIIRRKFLLFESAKFKLMDASTLLERKSIIKIVELFRSKHPVVLMCPSATPTTSLASMKLLRCDPPAVLKTRTDLSLEQELLRIQSLSGAKELVERFVGECYSWEGFTRERGPREAYDFLLGCTHLIRMLANLCDDDDLIKFYLALEVTRAANKQIWAQRAFRERKDAYLHSVEESAREGQVQIAELTAQNNQLQRENAILRHDSMQDTGHLSNMDISDLNMDFSSHVGEEEPFFSEMLTTSPSPVSPLHEACSVCLVAHTDL
ncbi:hypothetical protein HDU98_007459 [Podochytrium sp. JEL0797]|nr:hypothetical protein HDU98_007459 [Podochytrium sp. JEL0797]